MLLLVLTSLVLPIFAVWGWYEGGDEGMMGRWEMDGGCKMQKFWGEGEEAGELYMGGGIAVAEKSGWPGIKSLIAVQKSFQRGDSWAVKRKRGGTKPIRDRPCSLGGCGKWTRGPRSLPESQGSNTLELDVGGDRTRAATSQRQRRRRPRDPTPGATTGHTHSAIATASTPHRPSTRHDAHPRVGGLPGQEAHGPSHL